VGREYGSPFPNGEAAIEVWQRIRRGELSGSELSAALSGIRTILAGAAKPKKVKDSQWTAFQKFLSSADEHALLEYIKLFEWMVKAPDSAQMPERIKNELLRTGRAPSRHASHALYIRLFIFVIRRLSEQGLKVLTPEALDAVCSQSTMEPGDQLLMGTLRILIGSVDDRLRVIEEKTTENHQYLERIETDLGLLAEQSGVQGVVDYGALTVSLDIPPSVERVAKRPAAVNKVVESLNGKAWCALSGQISSGKTQFAILLTEALNKTPFWIRFRGLDVSQSCLRLDQALAQVSKLKRKPELRKWYSEVCGALPSGSIIVLDDLPGKIGSDDFDIRLLLLCESCSERGCTLISTSNEELPSSVRERAGRNLVTARIPFFNEEEAKELFLGHEAPPQVLNPKFVYFLWSLTRGHPMLLMALARYLLSAQWRISDSQLQGLFKGEYAEDLKSETRKLLATTIDDPETRKLLYRLYLVSPLLTALGASDVPAGTEQKVHEALALSIVRKGKLVPLDVITAFSHFVRARQHERAAVLIVLALSGLARLEDPISDDWMLSSIWAGQRLPDDITLGVQLYLRCQQVIVRGRLGKNIRYEIDDFDSILSRMKADDAFGIVGGCICLAIHFARQEPARANRYLLRGIKALPAFRFSDGTLPEIPERARPESLFFITGLAVRSEADLSDWISSLEGLDDPTLSTMFSGESGEDAAVTLCDHLWLEEDKKPQSSQNWDAVSHQLIMLGDFAKRHGLQLLWAGSVRARIIVQSEYQKDLGAAVSLAKQALTEISDDPPSVFLIQEAIGRQFVYAERWTEALDWLDSALGHELTAFPFLRMRAMLAASEAASSTDNSRAIGYCDRAVTLAENSRKIPETQVVIALGEKALAHWQTGDRLSTYQSWEPAVERLFATKSDDESWKRLLVICGHVSGYFSSMVSTGKPPKSDTEHVAPKPGMFLREYPQALQLYDAGREWGLAAQLAYFAIAVGRDEDAAGWALRAIESGRGGREEGLLSGLRMFAVCQAILDDRYGEALDIALDAGTTIATEYERWRGSMAHDQLSGGRASIVPEGPTVTSRAHGEIHAANEALIPIIFRLATIWLNDPEEAREAAWTVATECTRLAKAAENPRVWDESARLVNEIFGEAPSWQQLNEQGNEYAQRNENTPYLICYAGALLHVTPKDALRIQLGILPALEQQLERHGTFRRIVVPFILLYWERKFENSPYYFAAPALLKQRLQSLSATSPAERLRQTLHEMAFPLGLTLTESDRRWLK
jgi:hypothetical protein